MPFSPPSTMYYLHENQSEVHQVSRDPEDKNTIV